MLEPHPPDRPAQWVDKVALPAVEPTTTGHIGQEPGQGMAVRGVGFIGLHAGQVTVGPLGQSPQGGGAAGGVIRFDVGLAMPDQRAGVGQRHARPDAGGAGGVAPG